MRNIILIGFMASGKSVVGRLLAKALKFKFIDVDKITEKRSKLKIKEIFEKFGEEHFRKLETQSLKKISKYQKYVIATGGGIILKKENVRLLKKMGLVIYLKVSPEKVLERVGDDPSRPLLNVPGRLKKIKETLKFRREKYLKAADLVVDTDKLKPALVAQKIVQQVKRYEKKF